MSRTIRSIIVSLAAVVAVAIAAGMAVVWLAPGTALQVVNAVGRARAHLERHDITLPDGSRYAYLDGGTGEPLLLLHGFGISKDQFLRMAAALTPHYRVIAPDHLGFGESDHPADGDYTAAAQARRANDLLRALKIERANVGGNSMGGAISLVYAATYPDQTTSLLLINPAGLSTAKPSYVQEESRRTGRNLLVVADREDFGRWISLLMDKPPWLPAPVMDWLAELAIRNRGISERVLRQLGAEFDGRPLEDRIRNLKIPTLVVWGDRDKLTDVDGARVLKEVLANTSVVVFEGVGHAILMERPLETAAEYLKFRGVTR